jgi:predicted nucleic acid binding AN1-type Zn finger protein
MAKIFYSGNREAKLLSKIESSKERERFKTLNAIRDNIDYFANKVAMKLIESGLIETVSKSSIENQIIRCLDTLIKSEDFDVDYTVAPFRTLVANPNIASLYLTAFVVEKLINHKDVIDVYGSDEDIYYCIHKELTHLIAE